MSYEWVASWYVCIAVIGILMALNSMSHFLMQCAEFYPSHLILALIKAIGACCKSIFSHHLSCFVAYVCMMINLLPITSSNFGLYVLCITIIIREKEKQNFQDMLKQHFITCFAGYNIIWNEEGSVVPCWCQYPAEEQEYHNWCQSWHELQCEAASVGSLCSSVIH